MVVVLRCLVDYLANILHQILLPPCRMNSAWQAGNHLAQAQWDIPALPDKATNSGQHLLLILCSPWWGVLSLTTTFHPTKDPFMPSSGQ